MFSLTSVTLRSNRKLKPSSHSQSSSSRKISSSSGTSMRAAPASRKKNKKMQNKTQSYFLAKNRASYDTRKKEFLNYLIDQQLQYADLNEIENELKRATLRNKKNIDINNCIILKKKNELKSLGTDINKGIVREMKFDDKNIGTDYTEEMNRIKSEIASLTYDIEIYEEEKRRLQKEKKDLDKKIKTSIKEYLDDQKMYNDYLIVSDTVKRETRKQSQLLNQMRSFQFNSEVILDDKLRKKKSKFARAEYALTEVKKNVEELEREINQYKKTYKKMSAQLNEENERLCKNNFDYISTRKDFYSNRIKLYMIYTQVKMKKIDFILKKFKNDNIVFNTNTLMFNQYLKEMTSLRMSLSSENNISSMLKEKMNRETLPFVVMYKTTQLNENNMLANEEFEVVFKAIEILKSQNEDKKRKITRYNILIKKIIDLIQNYDGKFNNIIYTNVYEQIFGYSNVPIMKIKNTINAIGISNNDKDITILNKEISLFDISMFKLFLQIYVKFIRKIYIISEMLLLSLFFENSPMTKSDYIFTECEFNVCNIHSLFRDEDHFATSKKTRDKIYEQKIAIKSITNNAVFTHRNNSDKKLDTIQNKVTMRNILNSYVHSTNDYDIWNKLGTKFSFQLKKFTNDLVLDDKKTKLESFKEKNKLAIKVKPQTISSTIKAEKEDENDDSTELAYRYNNSNDNSTELKTNKSSTGRNFFNTSSNFRYKRMNDLYRLKYNLFTCNRKNDRVFNEIASDFYKKTNAKIYKEIKEKKKKRISISKKKHARCSIVSKPHRRYLSLKTMGPLPFKFNKDDNDDSNECAHQRFSTSKELFTFKKTMTFYNINSKLKHDNNVISFPKLNRQMSMDINEDDEV